MKIVSSASARPNFVKLAAVHQALKDKKGVEHLIVHTGQHYDPLLSDIFFKQLAIDDPKENLGVKGGASREETIEMTEKAMTPVLKKLKPDILLVYGDVNGAVGAARAAKSLGIRIGHVEAGLRSGDLDMPEEHNRIEIDGISDELFVTEQAGLDHLLEEKIKGNAHFVGNTMIDTLLRMKPMIESASEIFKKYGNYCVVTIHRPSNVDSKVDLEATLEFLREIGKHCKVMLPLHLRTKAAIESFQLRSLLEGMEVLPPLGYIEFLGLASKSAFIVTDSGGIQEEAVLLKKRCFTVRLNTERPATIESGSNVLIDLKKASDRSNVLEFAAKPKTPEIHVPELWDGKAGERIANILLEEHA